MKFDIKNKVALITGGASGIGLRYAKEFLKNGSRGVTLADVNPEFGKQAVEEITKEFGANKAIFIVTDVTNMKSFEAAFKKTVEVFKNVDILVNNAGILNDALWEKQIAVNLNGVINGVLLGLENYIPKHKTGDEGVILNISSIAALAPVIPITPIYSGTKAAVFIMTNAWGNNIHYQRTKVKVIAICPGVTITPLITEMAGRNLGPAYEKILNDTIADFPTQEPEFVASSMIKIVQEAKSGTGWVVEGGQPAYEYALPPRSNFKLK